jgi:hypothetical protein
MDLTWKQLAPFLKEVREVTGTLLFHLDTLQRASTNWLQATAVANAVAPDGDREQLAGALDQQVDEQTRLFDALEAFLASWARLSLLIFPLSGNDEVTEFRKARGEGLRKLLGVTNESALADRELRDSWMHFDERLDAAVSAGKFGNRHSFVRSERVGDYLENTLRLVEVDKLVVHFRSRDGKSRSVDIPGARKELLAIGAAAGKALPG